LAVRWFRIRLPALKKEGTGSIGIHARKAFFPFGWIGRVQHLFSVIHSLSIMPTIGQFIE